MLRIDDMQRQAVDIFRDSDISLKNELHYGTIQFNVITYPLLFHHLRKENYESYHLLS